MDNEKIKIECRVLDFAKNIIANHLTTDTITVKIIKLKDIISKKNRDDM